MMNVQKKKNRSRRDGQSVNRLAGSNNSLLSRIGSVWSIRSPLRRARVLFRDSRTDDRQHRSRRGDERGENRQLFAPNHHRNNVHSIPHPCSPYIVTAHACALSIVLEDVLMYIRTHVIRTRVTCVCVRAGRK